MGKRRTSTPSAREYIKEWRQDASTDRGARWGDNDAANRQIRAEVADDQQVILQLRNQIQSMAPEEAEAKLHSLLASTRKLEKGDPKELQAADPRVRLYAFIKSDRFSRAQRRQLLERWTRGVHEQKPSTSD